LADEEPKKSPKGLLEAEVQALWHMSWVTCALQMRCGFLRGDQRDDLFDAPRRSPMYEDDSTRRWRLRGSKLPVAACFMITPSRRHYLLCLERVAALPCGKARRLLPRLRLATAERRRIMPRHLIGPSRPRRIARISPSKTSQSPIFETNTVGVTPLAVSKRSCVFAA